MAETVNHSTPVEISRAGYLTINFMTPLSTGKRTRACIPSECEGSLQDAPIVEISCGGISAGLMVGFREMLAAKQLCDVIVVVQGMEFEAHKVVLASASSYFRYGFPYSDTAPCLRFALHFRTKSHHCHRQGLMLCRTLQKMSL